MTNHSPAPWKRDGFEIRDADGNLLAITVGESVDVEVANGNLMTAAPDMLAALEAAYAALVDAHAGDPSTRALIVQTIKAARGEQVGTEAR